MTDKTSNRKTRIKISDEILFLATALFVGFICALKKIAYPVEVPDIIGLTYSRGSDILVVFFGGMLINLIVAGLLAAFLSEGLNTLFPRSVRSSEELEEREFKKKKQLFRTMLILWISIALFKVIFTDAYNPTEFNKENEEYYDDHQVDEYFFK